MVRRDTHTISLEIGGPDSAVLLRVFAEAVASFTEILREVDAQVSGPGSPGLDWRLSGLEMGSAVIESTAYPPEGQVDYTPEVIKAVIEGLEIVEHEPQRPRYFSDTVLQKAQQLVRLTRDGIGRITVKGASRRIAITEHLAVNVDELIQERHVELGSVEGRLETISVHGRNMFGIWRFLDGIRVECLFPSGMLEQVKAALGERVMVWGRLCVNKQGLPRRVEVQQLRQLRRREELPQAQDIACLDPSFTGDLDSAAYVRRSRDE